MFTEMDKSSVNRVEQDPWAVTFKLDTGAKANLVNEHDIKAMKVKPHIHPNHKLLKAYNGQPIHTPGTCRLKVRVKWESRERSAHSQTTTQEISS